MVVTRSQDKTKTNETNKNEKDGKKLVKDLKEGKEKKEELKKERKQVQKEIQKEEKEASKEEKKNSPKRGKNSAKKGKNQKKSKSEKEEKSSSEETMVEESGNIFFAHKSTTNEEGKSIDYFYVQLEPNDSGRKKRTLTVARKRLPSLTKHERLFAFVAATGEEANQITNGSEGLGKGTYEFVGFHGSSHLAYKLSTENEGEAQKKLKKYNIHPSASFVIAVKNPEETSGNFEFPKDLQSRFKGRKWMNDDISLFLEHKGANLIFVGCTEDIVKELGEEGEHIVEEAEALKD